MSKGSSAARAVLVALLASGCASLLDRHTGSDETDAAADYTVQPVSPEAEADAAFMRGRAFELDRRYLEAAESYEKAVRIDPNSPDLQRALAQVWMSAGEPARALEYAERALALQPDDEGLRVSLASLHARMHDYDRAIELLEPVFQKGGLDDEGLFTLFTLYLNTDNGPGALAVAQRMVKDDPDDVRGYLALGAAYE